MKHYLMDDKIGCLLYMLIHIVNIHVYS